MAKNTNIAIGLEQASSTGNIFGSVVLNKNYLANSELEIIMYKSGNTISFHGKAQLSQFSACKF